MFFNILSHIRRFLGGENIFYLTFTQSLDDFYSQTFKML